ncbi:hypothetical protein TH8_19840 [Thalassospira profundimaris]|nr:hypothetical protein TH8_19840 [Thalassospira profundimaris]
MRLAICEPDTLKMVEFDDIWEDRLPEDMYLSDVSPELAEAVAKVNDVIQKTKPILSWSPGKFRTTVTAAALITAKNERQSEAEGAE